MKSAKDVIADNLPTFYHRADRMPNLHDLRDAADRILNSLRAEGYEIIRQGECLRQDQE